MFKDKNFDELNKIAMELVSNNQWDDTTIQVNQKIIEKKPNDDTAYTRLAKCLLLKGDREGAYEIYKKVLEFDPENTISWNFVKMEEFTIKEEKQKKENDERIAREQEEKREKDKEIKRMISEI